MHLRCGIWALLTAVLVLGCRDPGRGDGGNPDGGPGSDGGVADVFDVTTCERTLTPPAAGDCEIQAGTGSATIIRGNVIGRTEGFEHGEIVFDNERIQCVGCDCSASAGYAEATVIECANAAISSALINPHDHIRFTEGAPIDTGGSRYDHRHAWRGSLSTPTNPHGVSGTSGGMRWGELRMLFSGTVSMIGTGGADGLVRNLDRLDNEDRSQGLVESEYTTFSLGDSNETFHSDCQWDFRYDAGEVASFDAFVPHVAEGIDDYAAEEFRCQSRTQAGARDLVEGNSAFIHAIGLQAEDYLRMAFDNASIVWSPRSNISLYGHTAQVTTFKRFGGTIALGTDWTYSGSANTLRELACADQYNQNNLASFFTDKQLHDMATINAAIATGNQAVIGSLEVGKLADVAIYAAGEAGQFHRTVIEANNLDVLLATKAGAPLYGQRNLVEAFGSLCDAVTVCGDERSVCTTQEFGTTFAEIRALVQEPGDAAYDAIFCDERPAGEPTCTPTRPGEFTGAPSDGDRDGDGFLDGSDNCVDVFNPIRPIDDGAQPDADGDGIGDPCDSDPLIADLDSDGKENDADNCPFDVNGDQADGDSDGKGDICDLCPSFSNPDRGCSDPGQYVATTIVEIQNGTIAEDADVLITDVVVTAVSDIDFTVQDPGVTAPAQYAGVLVYLGSDSGLSIGDVVDITGKTTEFFGNTEITNANVTPKGTTGTITASALSLADAASEPYENVLVTVETGTVVDPYDCSVDDSACSDFDLWALTEGPDKLVVYDKFYSGSDWDDHKGETPVTGVTMWRRGSWRLMPRSASDF